ncbi:MAG TPA: hypothetical protein VFY99_11060, partial [Solirubrobacterales bacterium]
MAPRIGPLSVAGRLRGATLLIVAASFLVLPAGAPAAVVGGVGTIYMTDQESDGGSGTLFSVDGTNGDREVVSENGNPGGQP